VPAAASIAKDAIPLRVTGLVRHYGRLVGLAHFDLELEPGECVALIGANGSGKSTAVRTISGLLEPTEGTVRICGHDPHSEPDAEAARAALALVPDAPMLYDDLTVRQHLSLVALAHGVSDDGIEERIDGLLERLGLAHRADFLPAELSRGLKQKSAHRPHSRPRLPRDHRADTPRKDAAAPDDREREGRCARTVRDHRTRTCVSATFRFDDRERRGETKPAGRRAGGQDAGAWVRPGGSR
jgi:predicted ABC-type transport system involved in lysophospholipase L1 biosynthesis ATPase subunit